MKATSIGDLAQTFTLQKRSAALRETLASLSEEMSTGIVSDVQKRLGGDYAQLASFENRLAVLDSYRVANSEAAIFTDAAQSRLGRISDTLGELSNSLLALSASPVASNVASASGQAERALDDIVAQLNGSVAGRSVFSGTDTDSPALVGAVDILAAARVAASGSGTAAAAIAAIDNWFGDPAGFELVAYRGSDASLQPLDVGEGREVSYQIRADSPVIRSVIRDVVTTLLANDPALGLSGAEQVTLLSQVANRTIDSQDQLIATRADLGSKQETIESSAARLMSERLATENARNELLAADPFETATELEALQFQLESLYAVTVRSSQLSLVNFLR